MQNTNNKQKACPQCLKHSFCRRGFTIIEMMIAISLFLIVIMIGMGALLNANLLHQKSQDMRSILDNLSFIMEDMSNNLRTGYDYHCIDGTSSGSDTGINSYSCLSGGGGISFKSSDRGGQWKYYLGNNSNGFFSIFRAIDQEQPVQLTPDEVHMNQIPIFIVAGAEKNDNLQPFVTIHLVGSITSKGITTPFNLQTSVSQRLIDI